jgi:pimeloyl-ACP methyl ester carboxylesterase
MDRFVQTNGMRLHFLDHPGPGPTLLLMPGLTANAHSFDGLIAAGLNSSFRVLAVDLRGRGLSDKPEYGYTMADHAADILGLLEALKLERVILGGHSFGGLLTIYLAARHPEHFSRFVVIDAAARMHPDTFELIRPAIERLGKPVASWEQYLESMKQMPFYQGGWDPLLENYYRADVETRADGSVCSLTRPEIIAQAAAAVMVEEWLKHLAAISKPLLLLNAPGPYGPPGTPPILPRDLALETVNLAAAGRYVEIPGNHMTMLFGVGAKKMAAAIREFAGPEEASAD